MRRNIIYSYDETRATNKDHLIAALTGSIDDGGASYESAAWTVISCPYVRGADCLNEHEGNEYGTKEYRKGCARCKLAWLDREYDTYPSDDGKWERGEQE